MNRASIGAINLVGSTGGPSPDSAATAAA